MSINLKKIEIEAFRAYNKKLSFDFLSKKDILANLVVIYAPNGSGKTSFFDAIEWGLSGKIRRISENPYVKNIAENEKGKILLNIDSSKDQGTVSMIFSNDEMKKINTKIIKPPRKTDYDVGETITDTLNTTKESVNKLIKKNILTHDQIDRFLRFQNSKDRYEALKSFWDFNNDTEIYEGLLEIIKLLKDKKDDVKKEKEQLEKDLINLSLNVEKIQKLNMYIKEYNQISNTNQIDKVRLEDDIDEVFNRYILMKSDKEQSILKKRNNLNQVEKLLLIFKTNYLEKKSILSNIMTIEIPKVKRQLDMFTELKMYKVESEKFESELLKSFENLNKLNFLIGNKTKYDKKEELEKKILILRDKAIVNFDQISNKIINDKEKLINTEFQINKHKKTKEKIESRLSDFEECLIYENLSIEIENNKKKESKLKDDLMKINHQIIIQENDIKKINNYLMLKKDLLAKELEQNNFSNKINPVNFITNQNQLNDVNIKIEFLAKRIQENEEIGTELERLKKIGISFLSKSKSDCCPLCDQKYESFDELITKVQHFTSFSNQVNKQNDDLISLEVQKKEYEESRDKYFNDVKNQLNKILSTKKYDLEEKNILKQNIDKKLKQLFDVEKSQKASLIKLSLLKSKLNIEEYHGELLINIVRENLMNLKNEIIDITKLIELDEETDESLRKQIRKLEVDILSLKKQIDENNKKLNELNNDIVKKYELFEKEFVSNEKEHINYEEKVEILNQKIIEIKKEAQNLKEKINEINKQLDGKKENEIIDEDKKLNRTVQEIEYNLKMIEKDIVKNFGEEVGDYRKINEEYFGFKIYNLRYEIRMLNEEINILNSLNNTLSSYINSSIKIQKEEELVNKKEDLKNIDSQLKKIQRVSSKAQGYIDHKIKNEFNLDRVNDIFRMIDPHPQFKEIDFKLDRNLKDGKLGLDITCKEGIDDSRSTAPVLYLSSAQVNILSLSIFMASAIENTNDFNFILMDDPIQHLDGLNILSFIDLLRVICFTRNKQVIISTHDQGFFNLCQKKIDEDYYAAKYIDLSNLEADSKVKEF